MRGHESHKYKFKIRCRKITLTGRTCWDWKAGNKILHFLCLSWMTGTCPTSASLCPSWLLSLFYATWHPRTLPRSQQQKVLMRMARWSCHWTVRRYNIMSFFVNERDKIGQKFWLEGESHKQLPILHQCGLGHNHELLCTHWSIVVLKGPWKQRTQE